MGEKIIKNGISQLVYIIFMCGLDYQLQFERVMLCWHLCLTLTLEVQLTRCHKLCTKYSTLIVYY